MLFLRLSVMSFAIIAFHENDALYTWSPDPSFLAIEGVVRETNLSHACPSTVSTVVCVLSRHAHAHDWPGRDCQHYRSIMCR